MRREVGCGRGIPAPCARTDGDRAYQRAGAARQVHDARACKVVVWWIEARQPPRAPRPADAERVDDACGKRRDDEVAGDSGALRHRSRDDRAGGRSEDHVEEDSVVLEPPHLGVGRGTKQGVDGDGS